MSFGLVKRNKIEDDNKKMPKSKIIITLGVLIALLPILGFPRAWESFFQIATGASIVLLSVWATIDKHLAIKVKAQKRHFRKHQQVEVEVPKEVEEKILQEESI